MAGSRRQMLITAAGAVSFLAVKPLFGSQPEQARTTPKARPYPNGRDPNADPTNDEPSRPDPKAIQQANQKKLREDVAKLYEMAAELKDQVEKVDANFVVSVSFVKTAQQIEKLAKEIRNLARS